MKLYKNFLTIILFMVSTMAISAETAICTGKLSIPDNYTCCLTDNYIWANDYMDYPAPGCPQGSDLADSCGLSTIVFASDPVDISLKQDCTNHGKPNIQLQSLLKVTNFKKTSATSMVEKTIHIE